MKSLSRFSEPTLLFGFDQEMEDPRDGLLLFGPLDKGKPEGVCAGVVGTKDGIRRFKEWAKKIQGPIVDTPEKENRPPFVGFEPVFRCKWNSEPFAEAEIDDAGSQTVDSSKRRSSTCVSDRIAVQERHCQESDA